MCRSNSFNYVKVETLIAFVLWIIEISHCVSKVKLKNLHMVEESFYNIAKHFENLKSTHEDKKIVLRCKTNRQFPTTFRIHRLCDIIKLYPYLVLSCSIIKQSVNN